MGLLNKKVDPIEHELRPYIIQNIFKQFIKNLEKSHDVYNSFKRAITEFDEDDISKPFDKFVALKELKNMYMKDNISHNDATRWAMACEYQFEYFLKNETTI